MHGNSDCAVCDICDDAASKGSDYADCGGYAASHGWGDSDPCPDCDGCAACGAPADCECYSDCSNVAYLQAWIECEEREIRAGHALCEDYVSCPN